uniref:Small ribosomal subunit protein uS10 domain-containing protein n=2 Tax=Arion vulgaris TaxID=1028688 RepID=A0A0B6ZKN7_9EUPU
MLVTYRKMDLINMSRSLRRLPGCLMKSVLFQGHQSRRVLSTPSKWHGLFEPNDLKLAPDIPEFKVLHIQMRGHDFPVLESYAKQVHGMVRVILNLESDSFASPAKSTQVRTFHPKSVNVNHKFDLQTFIRTVAVDNVPTTLVPIILQLVQKNCPEAVEVSLKEPEPEEEEFRYVPDYSVLELQARKDFIASGKLKKK